MNKCIMVKVGGKQNTHEVCKKQVNFYKSGDICKSRGKIIIFAKQREMYWKMENRGKILKIGENSKFVVDDKKGHQKFWRMKIENVSEKGKSSKIFHRFWKFFENRGAKSETGGESASWSQRGWTPLTSGWFTPGRCTSSGLHLQTDHL